MKSMRAALAPARLLAVVCLLAPHAYAAELKQKTVEAFERYIRLTEARMEKELGASDPYLWVDTLPEPRRQSLYAQLQRGQAFMQHLQTEEGGRGIKVPDGRLHHWVGLIFIRGATIQQTLAVLEDYDNHAKIYKPEVRRSKLVSRNGNDFKISLQFFKKSPRTVVLNAEFDVRYVRLDASRAHSRSYSTRIAEVENPDDPDGHEYPAGTGHGYLWRLDSYWRFEEKDGGVYIQLEYIALSRSVPTGLGWLINPIINRISRESLLHLLNSTRTAVAEKPSSPPASNEAQAVPRD